MHKKIAQVIQKICNESPYNHFKCEIFQRQATPSQAISICSDGFWKCIISFGSRNDAHSESLVRAIPLIGLVYGETLFVDDKGTTLEVS